MTAATKSKPAKKAKHNPDATERHRKAALKEVQAKIAASSTASAKAPDAANSAPDTPVAPQQGQSGKVDKKDKSAKGEGTPTPKQLGGLDAAAIVLKAASAPLTCKEIWAKIDEKKMWFTEGKTPEATIYSAILREIQAKGKDSRFRKAARGKFEFCGKEG